MFEQFDKLIKKIDKLPRYYILRQDEKAAVVAHRIHIKHLKEYPNPSFQEVTEILSKKIGVFLLITYDDKVFVKDNILLKEFKERDLPVLVLHKGHFKQSAADLEKVLDLAVEESFLN